MNQEDKKHLSHCCPTVVVVVAVGRLPLSGIRAGTRGNAEERRLPGITGTLPD